MIFNNQENSAWIKLKQMHKMTKYGNNKICCIKYYWDDKLGDESYIFNSELIKDTLKYGVARIISLKQK